MTAPTATSELLACEVAVLRALEITGKKVRNSSRQYRGQLSDVPTYLMHTHLHIARTHEECERYLVGAWEHLALVVPDRPKLIQACDWYVRELIVKRHPHTRADLERVLAVAHG